MRTLLLGGSGFIGRALTEELRNQGHFVRTFDLLQVEGGLPCDEFVGGRFTAELDFTPLIQDVDVIFHLISTTLPSPETATTSQEVTDNILPTLRLLEALRNHPSIRLVFLSSGGTVYGHAKKLPITEDHPTDPICSYGIQKLTLEKYLHLYHQLHGLDHMILRLSNPYGTRPQPGRKQGAIGIFLERVINGETISIWGQGNNQRDYIHILDAAKAIVLAAKVKDPRHRILNIGTGEGASLLDILSLIERTTGLKPRTEFLPDRRIDVDQNILDCTRAREALHWSPVISLADGVRKFYRSYQK